MKKLLVGFAALPFLAGIAMAGQPTLLSDRQMDKVIAGQGVIVIPADSFLDISFLDIRIFVPRDSIVDIPRDAIVDIPRDALVDIPRDSIVDVSFFGHHFSLPPGTISIPPSNVSLPPNPISIPPNDINIHISNPPLVFCCTPG